MANITEAELRRVAVNARLAVDDDRVPALVEELNAMIAQADVLSRPALKGVQEAIGIGARGLPARGDNGQPTSLDRTLDVIAPAVREGLVLVPRLAPDDVLGAR